MCLNKECSIKEKCYRYVAPPSQWQSYSMFEGGETCKYFLPIYTKK